MQDNSIKARRGLTSNQLKLIAITTMAIDHVAACVLYGYLVYVPEIPYYDSLVTLYYIMRDIGRIAFPLFCFMIVQGFINTSNRKKYLLRLFILALIAEIPFNLCINWTVLYPEHQNTVFTLALGLICLVGLEWLQERFGGEPGKNVVLLAVLSAILIAGIGLLNEYVVFGDYGLMGIACIAAIYLLKSRPVMGMAAGYFALIMCEFLLYGSTTEFWAILALPIVCLYNGQKGKSLGGRYFFYIFYPAHLLLVWLILQVVWMAAL